MVRSSKAATASAATSKGSGTSAFWHIAYMRAVLMRRFLTSSSRASSLLALSTILLLSYDQRLILTPQGPAKVRIFNKERLESLLLRPEKTTNAFQRLSAPSQRSISRPGQ